MRIYESVDENRIVDWQWMEPSLRNLTHLVLRRVGRPPGRVLDVGCGTGRVSVALAARGFEVEGLDVEPRVIELASKIAKASGVECRFRVANFSEPVGVEPEAYDIVVSSEVLEHVPDYQSMMRNLHRCLRVGGRLVLTVPYDPRKFSVLDEYAGHLRRFTRAEVEGLLAPFAEHRILVTGFPFYRLFTRLYLLALRLSGATHSNEELWGRRSTRVVARLTYGFARLDNFFSFTKLGDAVVAVAVK